jgi:hypothetical protein
MVVAIMKTPNTSSRRIVVIALVAATTVLTVVGKAIPIVKPAYAQLDDTSREQIGGGEIEIPDSDAIRENVEEITSSQPVPRLAELGTLLLGPRIPPALAD